MATLDGSGHVPAAQLALALLAANDLSDLASAPTARANLGLGSAATQPSGAFDAAGAAAAVQALAVLLAGSTMGGYLAPKVVTLTDAATILVDASKGNQQRVTLGGDRAMGVPSNPVDGESLTFELVQDATGSRTVTWPTGSAGDYDFGSGTAPTLSTAAHAMDMVAFRYSAAALNGAGAWCYLGAQTAGF